MAHRFPIGTKYQPVGKHAKLCTVTDQLTTTNSKGEIVSERYISTHEFCGATVTNHDVVDTTIARGLTLGYLHLLEVTA